MGKIGLFKLKFTREFSFFGKLRLSKRRGIWEDGLDLNTLWADIANTCKQLSITVNYSQLSDPHYLNGVRIQLSDISNVPLSSGPKNNEDLRQFIDKVSETMELKQRKRPAKRRRVILVVSRESDTEDFEYSKLIILVMILMNDVSIDMFESTEIDTEDESVEIDNGSGETVERENNIANDPEDVAEILEQLQIDTGDEVAYINEIFGTDNSSAETVERENNIPNDSDDFADILEQLRRLRH